MDTSKLLQELALIYYDGFERGLEFGKENSRNATPKERANINAQNIHKLVNLIHEYGADK